MLFHTCLYQSWVLAGAAEPNPTKKCRCRRQLDDREAQLLLNENIATRIVVSTKLRETEIVCPMCEGDTKFHNCPECGNERVIKKLVLDAVYGDDLVAVVLAKRTPRTPTIEKAHMERAVERGGEERERIRLYNELTMQFQGTLGAQLRRGDMVEKEGTLEPENDPIKGTGRRYDYGRAI